ncbi:succinate dehydrogenase assembly factor 2 [Paracoccaceae bacterium]|nr:succinate dehydrogenase assembly factor 2 [Paracoccaceae bacterium]
MSIKVVRKKLSVRSWRRGTKELDLILGRFSDKNLNELKMFELKLYERFLSNDDYLIYNWLFNKEDCPKIFKSLIERIQEGMHR